MSPVCAHCRAVGLWLGTVAPARARRRRLGEKIDRRDQGPRPAAVVAAPPDLPAHADDDDVHRPSHHRRGALFRHVDRGLVAARCRRRPECLWGVRGLRDQLGRARRAVRLHLGAAPSHARRHPPFRLGPRLWVWPGGTRMAGARQSRGLDRLDGAAVALFRHVRHALTDRSGIRTSTMTMRTPLARVRGFGSARSGTEHFWRQRLTAIANALLTLGGVILLLSLTGRTYPAVRQILGSPLIAVLMLLFVLSITIHMKIGMQVIIEDYMHEEKQKLTLLVLNTFYAVAIGLAFAYAILKLSFGV